MGMLTYATDSLAKGKNHLAKPYFISEGYITFRYAEHIVEKSTAKQCFFLAGAAGFEPTDAGVKVLCLTAWRRPSINFKKYAKLKALRISGVIRGSRTLDLQGHNLAL